MSHFKVTPDLGAIGIVCLVGFRRIQVIFSRLPKGFTYVKILIKR